MGRLLVLGLLVWATPVWAEDEYSLDQEVDWVASRSYAAGQPIDHDPNLHAMFYQADPDRFIFSVGVWWTRLTGPVKFSNAAELDISETLGLRARKTTPYVRTGLRLGWLELILEGFWYDNSGDQLVTEEFEIDGVVFEVGDVIKSDLKIHNYRLTFGITTTRKDWITLTFQIGVGALWTEGSITTVNLQKQATWDQWLPLPLIGVSIKGYFIKYPWIYEAEFGWIGFSTSTFGAAAIDAKVAFGYEFNDWINAKIGYRFYGINADVDEVSVELDLSGFFIEGSILF